jgi:hypothetical protein
MASPSAVVDIVPNVQDLSAPAGVLNQETRDLSVFNARLRDADGKRIEHRTIAIFLSPPDGTGEPKHVTDLAPGKVHVEIGATLGSLFEARDAASGKTLDSWTITASDDTGQSFQNVVIGDWSDPWRLLRPWEWHLNTAHWDEPADDPATNRPVDDFAKRFCYYMTERHEILGCIFSDATDPNDTRIDKIMVLIGSLAFSILFLAWFTLMFTSIPQSKLEAAKAGSAGYNKMVCEIAKNAQVYIHNYTYDPDGRDVDWMGDPAAFLVNPYDASVWDPTSTQIYSAKEEPNFQNSIERQGRSDYPGYIDKDTAKLIETYDYQNIRMIDESHFSNSMYPFAIVSYGGECTDQFPHRQYTAGDNTVSVSRMPCCLLDRPPITGTLWGVEARITHMYRYTACEAFCADAAYLQTSYQLTSLQEFEVQSMPIIIVLIISGPIVMLLRAFGKLRLPQRCFCGFRFGRYFFAMPLLVLILTAGFAVVSNELVAYQDSCEVIKSWKNMERPNAADYMTPVTEEKNGVNRTYLPEMPKPTVPGGGGDYKLGPRSTEINLPYDVGHWYGWCPPHPKDRTGQVHLPRRVAFEIWRDKLYKDCDTRYGSWSYAADMVCPSNGTTCPDNCPHRVHGECANVFGERALNLMCGVVEIITSTLPAIVIGTVLSDWFVKKPAFTAFGVYIYGVGFNRWLGIGRGTKWYAKRVAAVAGYQ